MTFRATVVADAPTLAGLHAAWRDLAESAANAFLTPEWFDVWSRHYGVRDRDVEGGADDGYEPFVVAVHDGDELAGLLPLAARGREIHAAGGNVGDQFAPLTRTVHTSAVVAAAARALGAHPRHRTRHFVLDNVDGGAGWIADLAAGWPRRLVGTTVLTSTRPWLGLKGRTWEGFLAGRSRNFRQQVGRRRRDLEKRHDVRFRLADDPATLAADMDLFFGLHDRRWDERGGSSSTGERVRAFHTDWAHVALERGWLRLWFLELDGEPVAAWYGWNLGGRYCYYLAGFDPAYADRSVGFVLLCRTLEHAFAEGAEFYDLLLGDEPYKARFAEAETPTASVVLAAPWDPATLRARATVTARGLADRMPAERREQLRRAVRRVMTPPGARGGSAR